MKGSTRWYNTGKLTKTNKELGAEKRKGRIGVRK